MGIDPVGSYLDCGFEEIDQTPNAARMSVLMRKSLL
jgi:hypothetical protein